MKCHNSKLPRWKRGFAHTKQLPWLMSHADKIGRTHWVNQLGAAGAGLSTVIWIREQVAAAFWLTPALEASLSCSQLVVKQPRPQNVWPDADFCWCLHLFLFLEASQLLMFVLVVEYPALECSVGGSEHTQTKQKSPCCIFSLVFSLPLLWGGCFRLCVHNISTWMGARTVMWQCLCCDFRIVGCFSAFCYSFFFWSITTADWSCV